jgi:hypothetical protein
VSRQVRLREFCHSRTGDKGNDLTLSLIAYDPRHYDLIRSNVTIDRVGDYFGRTVQGRIERFELPNIGALNFFLHGALGGGCTKTLRRDLHGKAMSGVFLDMVVDVPDDFAPPALPV